MIVVKLGGATLQDQTVIKSVARDLAKLRAQGRTDLAIVHGGGPAINEELTRRGITWDFFEGQRITTPEMMSGIESALCGNVNRRIVNELVAQKVPAVGFSGTDASTLNCKKSDPRLGEVGVVENVNPTIFEALFAKDLFPVMAPVGIDRDARRLNVNADWAAAHVAIALKADQLLYLTDQEGILDAEKKLISRVNEEGLERLIANGVVQGGMLAKTRTILHALRSGVKNVVIASAKREGALFDLVNEKELGTRSTLR